MASGTENLVLLFFWFLHGAVVECSEAQQALIKELFLSRDYDATSRPVQNLHDNVTIHFGLTLNILVFVSDMDQVMKTNGYLELGWTDSRLTWNPDDYNGISVLRLPVDKFWQPDLALTNTVDGQFLPNYQSNALVYADGSVFWVPPFIFKTGCDTNPFYFPFDEQLCNMVFRSTTYHARELDIQLTRPKMELKDYYDQPSGTWDVTSVPLSLMYRNETRKHEVVPTVSVQLDLWVRRKSQFYVITFLLPCVCIAVLTIFVFYLPIASGERLCLAISILFTIVVFLLILIDILPPSDSLPLMTKFLLFTFVCNFMSTILTTIIVNWSFRTLQTYTMRKWIKKVFLDFLPEHFHIRRSEKDAKKKLFSANIYNAPLTPARTSLKRNDNASLNTPRKSSVRFAADVMDNYQYENKAPGIGSEKTTPILKKRAPLYGNIGGSESLYSASKDGANAALLRDLQSLGEYLDQFPGYCDAVDQIAYIAKDMETQDDEGEVADDWKFVAVVADRIMLWVYLVGNLVGSLSILLNSPHLFTERAKP